MNKLMTGIYDSLNLTNIPALQGNAKVYDGSSTFDVVQNWLPFEYTDKITIFIVADLFTNDIMCFLTHDFPTSVRGFTCYRSLEKIYMDVYNNADTDDAKMLISSTKLKIGKVAFAYTLSGSLSANNDYLANNGIYGTNILVNALTGSIINPSQKLVIGRYGHPDRAGIYYCNAAIKKLQILGIQADKSLMDKAMNQYTFEGITSDGNFLLDVDFNKTTGNPLTTRAGTPSYTITPYGSNVFSSFL